MAERFPQGSISWLCRVVTWKAGYKNALNHFGPFLFLSNTFLLCDWLFIDILQLKVIS